MAQLIYIYPGDAYNPRTGYGKMSIGVRDSLKRNDYQVRDYSPRISKKDVLVIGHPFADGDLDALRRNNAWLYTMSESNRLSAEWRDVINQTFKGVIVPCRELISIYEESGITVPIRCIPLGVNPPLVKVRQPQRKAGHIVIGYSLGDTRKGDELTLFAFQEVFGSDPTARLVMKTRAKTWWDGCQEPNVKVISRPLSEYQWQALLSIGDMFVFPTRGEGFGYPPREAALVGVPAICTKWLGTADVGQWGLPIRVSHFSSGMFSHVGANAEICEWAEPDYQHLVAQMRNVRDYPEMCREHAAKGRDYLLKMCDWDEIAHRVAAVFHV